MATIEELVHIARFRDQKQKFVVSMNYANSLILAHFERILGEYQLTLQQFNALRILRGQHPRVSPLSLIKDRMIDRNSDASRLVGRLVKAGLVSNTANKVDRRISDIIITEKGLNLLKKIDKKHDEMDGIAGRLNNKELKEVNALLQKFLDKITD